MAGALILGAAQNAFALKEVEKTLRAAGDHSAIAKCPRGMHLVSGGGFTGTGSMSLGQTWFKESRKSANGWIVTGDSNDDSNPNNTFIVTAYAYCAHKNLHLKAFPGNVPSAHRVTSHAGCGSGHIVSGGGSVTGRYGLPFRDAKSGNGWDFAADSSADGGAITTTEPKAFAYCTPGRYRLRRVAASGMANPNFIKTKTAHCPQGTKVVSGGADTGASPYAVLWYSRKQGNGWRITVNSGPNPTTITAYAYCH
jgi:hypothetical protein